MNELYDALEQLVDDFGVDAVKRALEVIKDDLCDEDQSDDIPL